MLVPLFLLTVLLLVKRSQSSVYCFQNGDDVVLSMRTNLDSEQRMNISSSSVMFSLGLDQFNSEPNHDDCIGNGLIRIPENITLEGKVQVTADNLTPLSVVAQHFKVDGLIGQCNDIEVNSKARSISHPLSSTVNPQCSTSTDNQDWVSKAPSHLMNGLLSDQSSMRMGFDVFSSILKLNSLMMDEREIWLKSVKWAEYQTEIHGGDVLTYLTKLKPFIRFPLMTEEFIIKEVFPTKLLSSDEFTAIVQRKYQPSHKGSLFCSSNPRTQIGEIWDRSEITNTVHSLSNYQKTILHSGENGKSNAFLHGIMKDGKRSVEYEIKSGQKIIFGVMQSTKITFRTKDRKFRSLFTGIGYYSFNGRLHYGPGSTSYRSFSDPSKPGDRIRVTVEYSDESHASLTFHKNGQMMRHSIKLEDTIDVTKGIKFAVQTHYDGDKVSIVSFG